MSRWLIVSSSLVLTLGSPADAHHSPAAFEMSQVVAFEGVLTDFDWRNPHVYLTVEDRGGVEWLIESDATPVLSRSGWTSDSFAAGDAVSVRMRPGKDPQKAHGLLLTIEGPNGTTMASMNRVDLPGNSAAPASTTDIAGVWKADLLPLSSPIRLPLIGALMNHPMTEKARAAEAAFDRSTLPVCLTYATPGFFMLSGLYLTEFELSDDVIVIRNEWYNTERTIYMDGRNHPQDRERTLQGHSIGSWESDTLVVDTRLFADHPQAHGLGVPSGAQKHVVERFTLSEDGAQLLADIFVEDPEYLLEPFTGSVELNYSPHLGMLSLDCDPEVANRFLLE